MSEMPNERFFEDAEIIPIHGEGAQLLDDLVIFMRRFVVMTPVQADAIALWVAHTHMIDSADATPYVAITSAEKRSGKTLLLEVLELLVNAPLVTANIATPHCSGPSAGKTHPRRHSCSMRSTRSLARRRATAKTSAAC